MAGRALLIVADDRDFCIRLADFLGGHNYHADFGHDGRDGLALAASGAFDLMLLDSSVSVLDGFEVLRQVRKRSAIPVIMLANGADSADRIRGLNEGADDYLQAPFDPDELLARVRAVLRRTGQSLPVETRPLESAGVAIDGQTRQVQLRGRRVKVTAIEFDILEYLVRHAGRVVSRDALAAVLYQRQSTPYERAIDVHVSHLRKKLEPGGGRLIHTIRGSGYLFASGSRPAEPDGPEPISM